MPLSDNSRKLIENWFHENNITNYEEMLRKLEIYHDIFFEWSGVINLVSSKDRHLLVENHIIDSLSPVTILKNKSKIVDVGSGGGVPAIPLGIIRPDLKIVMVESRQKKVKFLDEALKVINCPNLSAWLGRIEDYRPNVKFEYATIRAVALTPRLLKATSRLLAQSGKILYYERRGEFRLIDPSK